MQLGVQYRTVDRANPLRHDRAGLLTALTTIGPEQMREEVDFMRQLISGPNVHKESLFAITYEANEQLNGRFQVIGEIESGWDTLVEVETACVQPLAYYYPNNQHLIAYLEQTGVDDPVVMERIALGLKTDSYVPGLFEQQLALDSSSSEDKKEQDHVPIALTQQLETREKMEMHEKEKQAALDTLAELDVHSYNKAQKYPGLDNPRELTTLPTIGPGPMTASAVITDCGIYERERTFISSARTYLGLE